MAKFILKDAYVSVNGTVFSDHASKVTVASTFNEVDVTAFGETFKEVQLGLGDASMTVDFFADFAASSIDQTLWPLHTSGSVFPIIVKPTSATASATNPAYVMQAVLSDYNPLDGTVGAASTTSIKFSNAGTAGITRATSGY
jgi:hypothetical protein